MMNSRTVVESLSSSDLRSATWDLVRRSHGLDCRTTRSPRRDRGAEALPRLVVLFDVRLLRRRARLFRRRRLQPHQPRPRRATHANHLGCSQLGEGAPGRTAFARTASDHREPGEGTGRGRGQVETPDRGSWSRVLRRSQRSHRSCADFQPGAIPRRSQPHYRSASPVRQRRPSRSLHWRSCRQPRLRRGPRLHRSPRTPSSSSSPRRAGVMTCSERRRICSATESQAETSR